MTAPQCCVCGRFCPWDSDQSTPFGDATMYEPPDPEFYCAVCAGNEETRAVNRGFIGNDWRKANWQYRAAKRIGLVARAPGPMTAWTEWVKV